MGTIITKDVIYIDRRFLKCQRCGIAGVSDVYEWTTAIEKQKVLICRKCAPIEAFGSKFKQNRRYKAWQEKRKKLLSKRYS